VFEVVAVVEAVWAVGLVGAVGVVGVVEPPVVVDPVGEVSECDPVVELLPDGPDRDAAPLAVPLVLALPPSEIATSRVAKPSSR